MHFESHIFISYAHLDNRPFNATEQGWISRFHELLETILSMRLGREARIWRDDKLDGNDVFSDEILDQFPKTALLITVLSPRYLESEWCTREAHEFCKAAEIRGGLVVGNKSRVFKVIKTPVESQDRLPTALRQVLGYPFFTLEEEAPLELDPVYGTEYGKRYTRRIAKLAWDLAHLLKRLSPELKSGATVLDAQPPRETTIYLSETSHDRSEDRESLEFDLQHHGYTVLPGERLPLTTADCAAEIETQLARCQISVHLFGDSYGVVPDGPSTKSIVDLQNELAAQRARSHGLRRLLWVPEDLRPTESRQQKLLEAIRRSDAAQAGAELVTGDFEDLKGTLHSILEKLARAEPSADPWRVGESRARVYVLCAREDLKAVVPLLKLLRSEGFETSVPVLSGSPVEVRRANEILLATCDVVILYYGSGDEAWRFHQHQEIRKRRGLQGVGSMRGAFTYLAPPATEHKEFLIEVEETNLIDGLDGFDERAIGPFLKAMSQS